MISKSEKEFLAQVAMGWFKVNLETGEIWRWARSIGGSKTGTSPYMKMLKSPERAERCRSRNHLKIWFTVASRMRMAVYAHRIIWMIANNSIIPEGLEINHKDGNPVNNKPGNLEIVTRKQNMIHAGRILKVLGKKEQRGEMSPVSKLTNANIQEIRTLCKVKSITQSKIAEMFNVKQSTISSIHRRKSWGHLED